MRLPSIASLLGLLTLAASPAMAEDTPPKPTRLEWALSTSLTGAHVRPRAKAVVSWTGDTAGKIAMAVSRAQSFARLDDPHEDRVRVVVDGSRVQVAVFIDVRHLWTVASQSSLVHPNARRALAPAARHDPGIHLNAGAPLRVVGRRGAKTTRVRLADDVLIATGHIATAALGIDFVPSGDGDDSDDSDPEWGQLAKGEPLRASPGGAVVAKIAGPAHPVVVLRRRGKHALVEAHGEFSRVVGWVPRSRLKVEAGILGGLIGGLISGGSGGRHIRLGAGTPLRHAPRGPVIGVVKSETLFLVQATDGEWTAFDTDTEIGELRMWARSDAAINRR